MSAWPTLADGRMLVLRTNAGSGESSHGFTWPHEAGAVVTAPDWNPDPALGCGHGLHGLLWGCGNAGLLHRVNEDGTVWLVLAVDPADIATPLDDGPPDKVRFRTCEVVHVGDRLSATGFLAESGGSGLPIVYGTATAGYAGTATAGYAGTATAGYAGTATAGVRGTATAGEWGVLSILFYDKSTARYVRRRIGEVDGITLKPNTPYRIVNGEFKAVTK